MNTSSQSQPGYDASTGASANTEPSAPLKPSEVLERAAALIEPDRRWVQFVGAASAFSVDQQELEATEVDANAPQAVCWCAAGAIWAIVQPSPVAPHALRGAAMHHLKKVVGPLIPDFNDAPGRTQAEVVAALRKAAEMARADEAASPAEQSVLPGEDH